MDVALWAHEHEYQRMWPVYNRTVYNGTTSSNPYEDPRAPVHLITGSAVSHPTIHEAVNIVTVDATVCRVVRSSTMDSPPQCHGMQPVTLTTATPT